MLIAVAVANGVARIALLAGDTLTDYAVWHLQQPDGLGDVHTGRITAAVPAMAGSFVDIGGGVTGFLPDSAGAAGQPEGTYLAVAVTRAAQGGKGPRLAGCAEPPAAAPGLIRRGPSPLAELAAQYPAAAIAVDDHGLLATLRPSLGPRIAHQAVTFDPVLEDEIATLYDPHLRLAGGAVIHISPTPALTAIDIDAGGATAAQTGKTAAQWQLNTALLPELARQIRLRNLSGAILVDFAGLKSRHRAKLAPALAAALASDPLAPKLHGFTTLGFAEISRPRRRPPLHESPP